MTYTGVNILKNQTRIVSYNQKIMKLYDDLVGSERLQWHRMTDNQNLVNIHDHIDKFYPLTGVDTTTRDVNEVTRIFLKAFVRIYGGGSVNIPHDDPLNTNYRTKLPYFLEQKSQGNTNLEGSKNYDFWTRNNLIVPAS